MASLKNIIGKG